MVIPLVASVYLWGPSTYFFFINWPDAQPKIAYIMLKHEQKISLLVDDNAVVIGGAMRVDSRVRFGTTLATFSEGKFVKAGIIAAAHNRSPCNIFLIHRAIVIVRVEEIAGLL